MLLHVKIINGAERSMEVAPNLTIHELKKLLANDLNVPVNQQRIMFKGKPLSDTSTLEENSITEGTKIHLVIKKESTESEFNRELKAVAKNYVTDVDQFAITFNKELKRLVNELSLDDIERYDELKDSRKQNKAT